MKRTDSGSCRNWDHPVKERQTENDLSFALFEKQLMIINQHGMKSHGGSSSKHLYLFLTSFALALQGR